MMMTNRSARSLTPALLGLALAASAVATAAAQTPSVRAPMVQYSYEASEDIPRLPHPSAAPAIAPFAAAPDAPAAVSDIYVVTNTSDAGVGSLRQAIVNANVDGGLTQISFALGTGPAVITPGSALPGITSPVIIDGTTQGGYEGVPLITIDGNNIFTPTDGLVVWPGGAGSTIRGVVICFFPGNGIVLNASHCVVEGCYIGTTSEGLFARGNSQMGIWAEDASYCRIGGTAPAQKNVISGNGNNGIIIRGNSTADTVQGNYIGTEFSGTFAVPNAWDGVRLNIYSPTGYGANNCLIGGTAIGAPNIIAGNDSAGVALYGSSVANNRVVGNYIGTNPAGKTTIGNGTDGVRFWNSLTSTGGAASANTIGGPTSLEGNLIVANKGNGIGIVGGTSGGNDNRILANKIGIYPSHPGPYGNGHHGIALTAALGRTIIGTIVGGNSPDSANTISGNHGAGVSMIGQGIARTRIVGNSIYANDSLGIDLDKPGVTPDDTLDADLGPNGLQNFPVIDSVRVIAGSTYIRGRFMGAPSTTVTVDFYMSPSPGPFHFGEGKTHIAQAIYSTGPSGMATLVYLHPSVIPADSFITMTATDPAGNTSELSQAFSWNDSDGDGILDMWETPGWGIDVNSDGKVDLDLNARGAWADHKDVCVEVDAMMGFQPRARVLLRVQAAFATVPNRYVNNPDGVDGINLIIDPLDSDSAITPVADFPNVWPEFYALKKDRFGTKTERDDPNARFILEAKRLVYRYCLFAKTFGPPDVQDYSGTAEIGGNDFMVTLGGWPSFTSDDQAGTFMHELGHTLGLKHGGGDDVQYKPNYYSVMNYTWQVPHTRTWQTRGSWRLDYSPDTMKTLSENALNETLGLDPPAGVFPFINVPFSDKTGKLHFARLKPSTAADWDGNRDSSTANLVSADLNIFPIQFGIRRVPTGIEVLRGYADWSNLQYNFRNGPDFSDGSQTEFDTSQVELSYDTFLRLESMPPPKPEGFFQMDGLLDDVAVPVGSNGGATLYAAMRGTQLYVAATPAASLGRDVVICVATDQRPFQPAPRGKAGNVGRWVAVLEDTTAGPTPSWYDTDDNPALAATVDTTGSVVEGVVDMELMLQTTPAEIYLALGTYQSSPGGSLISQVPAGNGDGNIDPSEFILLPDGALPIQLAGFTTSQLSPQSVQLTWKTVSETNNYGFEVQRKTPPAADFQTLPGSFIPGHGTTNAPQIYQFVDSLVSMGRQWYRLKQIDLDGTLHYSDPASIDLALTSIRTGIPREFALSQNTPNPFNPSTSIIYQLHEDCDVTLIVYDLLGREVETLVHQHQQAGTYTVRFDATRHASGVYVYRLNAGKFSDTRKMALVR